jgi:hypothetical protein
MPMIQDASGLAIDTSICLHTKDIPPEPLEIGELPEGLAVRPLRRFGDGNLRSGVVTIPVGWQSDTDFRVAATQQVFVLEGELHLGKQTLGANGFFVCPGGTAMESLRCTAEAKAIFIFDGPQDYTGARAAGAACKQHVIGDVFDVEPIVPVIGGRPLVGFERRVLWLDDKTGADTRLLKVAGGFEGQGPSWHGVNEEIFCLSGDIAPDDTRPMTSGSYLWNPARSVHGFHEHSNQGCTLLEWHDGPWDINFYDA